VRHVLAKTGAASRAELVAKLGSTMPQLVIEPAS
jgi:hypothetical protein